jgi:hypothetical protein
MWENEDVWILGGGPSVTKQFGIPEEIVRSVIERSSPPSVYSPYMEAIHDKHVIGINVSFMIGDWMDIVFFGDNGFLLRNEEALSKYPGIRATCTDQMPLMPDWVRKLEKDRDHPKGISKKPGHVSWNGNSGAAAINIAAHAGATRIILLGFDMNLTNNKVQHWHDVYQKGEQHDEKVFMTTLANMDRHLRAFPQIALDARKMGIEIINASPTSEVKEFIKVPVSILL